MKHTLWAAILLAMVTVGCNKDEKEDSIPCNYTVGPWSAWDDGYRTRTVTASATGCTGNPPPSIEAHPCVAGSSGFIAIRNNGTNPYSVTITGPTSLAPFTLQGGSLRDSIFVGNGTYGLYAVQLSGYVVFPSEFNATANVTTCADLIWSFP